MSRTRTGAPPRVVELTLNGEPVTAREDQTILNVAQERGIDIPTMCWERTLTPVNACRVCVCEVKGARTLAQSRGSGERANNVSIFSVPLRRDQIDRYHENYRSDRGSVPQLGRVMAAKGVTPLGRDRTLAGRLTYLSGRGIHGRSARPVETA